MTAHIDGCQGSAKPDQSDGCICSYGNTLHGDWVRVPEADCPAHIEGSGRET